MRLPVPLPFDFQQCLVYLNRSPQERLHFVVGNTIVRLFKVNGAFQLCRVSQPEPETLQVEFLNGRPEEPAQTQIRDTVLDWFDMTTDIAPFYHLAEQDDILRELIVRHRGFRLIRIQDLFQALCWSITGQQINIGFAYTLYRRLVENFGERFEHDGQTYWMFPAPATIAKLEVQDLMQLQNTRRKSEYIIGIAQMFVNNEISREKLLAANDFAAARKKLLSIRGIGPWTANYVLMRCLGDGSAFPSEDVGLHHAIKNLTGLTQKPTAAELRLLAERWGEWRAYAAAYLYRSLL